MAGTVEIVDSAGNAFGSAAFNAGASGSASTVPTDASVTVNATTTVVLAANPTRISALIVNTGSVIVYLKQNGAATTSHFPLNPGASLTIRHQLAVNGIVATGTGTVWVLEEAR